MNGQTRGGGDATEHGLRGAVRGATTRVMPQPLTAQPRARGTFLPLRSCTAGPCLSSAWSRPSLSSSRCRSRTSSGCSCGTCSSRPVCRYYYHAFSCNSFLLLHDSPPTPHAQHALFHTPFLLSIVSVSFFRRWSSAQTCFRMSAGPSHKRQVGQHAVRLKMPCRQTRRANNHSGQRGGPHEEETGSLQSGPR